MHVIKVNHLNNTRRPPSVALAPRQRHQFRVKPQTKNANISIGGKLQLDPAVTPESVDVVGQRLCRHPLLLENLHEHVGVVAPIVWTDAASGVQQRGTHLRTILKLDTSNKNTKNNPKEHNQDNSFGQTRRIAVHTLCTLHSLARLVVPAA